MHTGPPNRVCSRTLVGFCRYAGGRKRAHCSSSRLRRQLFGLVLMYADVRTATETRSAGPTNVTGSEHMLSSPGPPPPPQPPLTRDGIVTAVLMCLTAVWINAELYL